MSEIKTLNGYSFVDTTARENISQLSEEFAELKGEKPSEVTYEPDLVGWLKTDGTIGNDSVSRHTDYIPLDGYDTIIASAFLIPQGYVLAFFDEAKQLLPNVSILGESALSHINMAVPSGAAYCMLSHYPNGNATPFITLKGSGENENGVLQGKTIAFLGDSITSTDYATPNYWQIIAEKTGMNPLNYSYSGSRIASVDGDTPDSFVERAAAMDTSADAVFVMGGTNDVGLNTLLGEWDSDDASTFYGALNALIGLLHTNFPSKPIIFATPMKRTSDTDNGFPETLESLRTASATEAITMQRCVLAIKAKCARHGIPVVDVAEHSGIGAECTEYFRDDDWLHPSALGHVRIANMVQAELEKQFTHTAD